MPRVIHSVGSDPNNPVNPAPVMETDANGVQWWIWQDAHGNWYRDKVKAPIPITITANEIPVGSPIANDLPPDPFFNASSQLPVAISPLKIPPITVDSLMMGSTMPDVPAWNVDTLKAPAPLVTGYIPPTLGLPDITAGVMTLGGAFQPILGFTPGAMAWQVPDTFALESLSSGRTYEAVPNLAQIGSSDGNKQTMMNMAGVSVQSATTENKSLFPLLLAILGIFAITKLTK